MEISLEEEKKRGNEMEASLITLKVELEHKDLQIESLLNTERKLICEREGLEDKLGVALNRGKELDSLLEEADNRARKVASYFEEEVQKREKQICDLLSQEEQLEGQVLTLNRANERWQRELHEKRKDEEDLQEEKKQLENQVENLSNEWNDLRREMEERSGQYQLLLQEKAREQLEMKKHYEEILKQKDHEIEKLREDEDELKQLRQECEMLKEKCRTQEENMIREEQGFRERQRRLEEALKTQDKYMLMAFSRDSSEELPSATHLHCSMKMKFLTTRAKRRREQDKFAEPTTRKENEGQEEDPCELLRMRKEKQHRKYCDAQRERTNYGKQWEVLTQTLTDVIHGDERIPEATMGDGNKNSGVSSEPSVQNGEEAIPRTQYWEAIPT
ncbi:golgin subfamily A member 6-like protein 22 [Macrobrachium rosenbergii]|uniref:golgin subfamily A member 6-like protein 22 n=1 Tax=Macrobrachium rosenbergii TaxID=79674 RepID=UPI0034D69550